MIRKIVNSLPGNGQLLKDFYWRQRFYLNKLKTKFFSKNELLSDPDQIFWINPQNIQYHTNYFNGNHTIPIRDRIFDTIRDTGKIFDGDWDLSEHEFQNLEVYKAFRQRIFDNISWKDTTFYSRVLKSINSGKNMWYCYSKEDLDKRMSFLDNLIDSIKNNGYKLSSEIQIEKYKGLFEKNEEVLVNIGRNGQLLFQNGRHRLSIALLLEINRIPVKIHVRHKGWIEFLKIVKNYIPENGNYLYQPTLHPELDYLFPIKHKCYDRFRAMSENLPNDLPSGNLLDIGANTGYFCHMFSRSGYNCTAIENHPSILYILKKLMKYRKDNFAIFDKSIFDFNQVATDKFQIVLALNIFHHFLKTKNNYNRLVHFLNKLNTKILYFEPHIYEEKQMNGAFKNLDNLEFVRFIINNSKLKNFRKIFQAEDKRSLYILY